MQRLGRLRQNGFQVTLFESGKVGAEASWAGAGMLAPGGELEQRTWWTDLALESLKLYPAFVRELEAESGVSIDYRACGALEFAHTEQEWQQLQQTRLPATGMGHTGPGRRQPIAVVW